MFRSLNNKAYEVGGSNRNRLIGKKANDIDWVIVATVEEFEAVFPDAKRVGNSFPVYLHPETGDEIALTRSEYSTGDAYQDFELDAVGVSIEKDLERRDFTINSIAKHYVTGDIVDIFNGISDIHNKLIRTVNESFVKDDPLRVYRLARFASEFEFDVEENTANIVRRDAVEIKRVLPDRIYVELKKNYERSAKPSIFFRVLSDLNVLKYNFPYFNVARTISAGPSQYHNDKSVFDHLLDAFDRAKSKGHSFDVAIASLHHDIGKILTDRKLLPHHYGHENRGIDLVEFIENHHRFTAKQIELIKLSGKQHMRFHVLEKIKTPVKLVRFYKAIKKHVDEVIQVADNDHALNENQYQILADLKKTFKTTTIEIPDEIKKRGRESIVNFVESQYVKTYKEIVN